MLKVSFPNLSYILTMFAHNLSLGNNEVIHEYLDRVQLRKFIPQKFTHAKDHPDEIARRQIKRAREDNKPRRKHVAR